MFDLEDRHSRELVRDLHRLRPSIFWADLLASASIGWTGFIVAIRLGPFSVFGLLGFVLAVFALYRGLCFLHEITHVRRNALPAFEPAWNILFGFPLVMPSFMYVGVHQDHHAVSTYGTIGDPEYLPFGRPRGMPLLFALQSFLVPVVLLVRFLVAGAIGLAVPTFHRWLAKHASALSMNIAYCRDITPKLSSRIGRDTALVVVCWACIAGFSARAGLGWRVPLMWLAVSSLISFVNTLRTLGAHRYESTGEILDRRGQLEDSIDTPGGWWTELWAPVGLRYHALHHYFPGIPYHNLGEAHRRLMRRLPPNAIYRKVSARGLFGSLQSLYRRARTRS